MPFQVKGHCSVPFNAELYYCTLLFNNDVTIRWMVYLFYITCPCIIQSNDKNLHRCYIIWDKPYLYPLAISSASLFQSAVLVPGVDEDGASLAVSCADADEGETAAAVLTVDSGTASRADYKAIRTRLKQIATLIWQRWVSCMWQALDLDHIVPLLFWIFYICSSS